MPNAVTTKRLAELRAAGASAADAAAALAADPRFAKRIDAEPYLRALWVGTNLGARLEEAANNEAIPTELRWAIRRVHYAVLCGGYLDTTNATYATELREGVATLVVLEVLTQEEADELLALGGGYLIERLSEQEVAEYWAAQDAAAAREALAADAAAAYNAVVEAIDGGETSRSALVGLFASGLGVE